MDSFRAYIELHQHRFVAELGEWLRIPSVSAQPEHRTDMARSAEHLAACLQPLNPDQVAVWQTRGHPAVFASWKRAPGKPTVLIYGHHDVQPVDPLQQWISPPFEASVRDGRLYARGATDDKGQVWIHVKAIETLHKCLGELPVNLLLMVEGEEEVGSTNLLQLFRDHPEQLAADLVCVSDTDMLQPGLPSICTALRGIAYFELRLRSASGDLHSGSFGGAVSNAANEIVRVLSSLHGAGGEVAIEGFYDDVRPASAQEREAMAAIPFDAELFGRQASGAAPCGETGYSTLERLWTRPALDLHGITAGFQAEGSKTVIPAVASAKLSFRLVADQTPQRVEQLLRAHLARVCAPGVAVELKALHSGRPYRAPAAHPAFAAARSALKEAFGRTAVLTGEGGSIPFVREISDATARPCLLMGFGLPDGNAHAPNEWLSLDNFVKGIESVALLYQALGA